MNRDGIKEILEICENSDLTYFKYMTNEGEVSFSKCLSYPNSFKSKSYLCDGNVGIEDKVIKDMSTDMHDDTGENRFIIIESPYVGIIHLEKKLKEAKEETKVNKRDLLCTIEAMKLYNNVNSTVSGLIIEVLVNDGDQVEYGQPLVKIEENLDEEI